MMVNAQEKVGEGLGLHTDPYHTPTDTQPSSFKPQKKIKPKRKQRQATRVHSPSSEIPVEESIPTPSNDPLPSGEDSIQLNELIIFCINLQQQGRMHDANMFRVYDLEGNEVIVDVREIIIEKEVSTADPVTTIGEVVTAASVEDSAAPTTTTTTDVDDELTLAKTLIEIKVAKPKVFSTVATTVTTAITTPRAKGIVFNEQVQAHVPTAKELKIYSLGSTRVHSTFHVSNLKKCLSDESLVIPLDEIQIDDKLHFIEEPIEIMDREVKRLKQSRIFIVKVRWNSKRDPEFTWEREDQFPSKYPHLFTNTTLKGKSN
nr:putative reverse transcriptase domain-containing protein [Tanacetum cinerariifolium]